MNPSPRKAKAILREQLHGRQTAYCNRTAASTALCQIVMQSAPWVKAHSVLAFVPREDEPNIEPLLHVALADGKALFLPRWNAQEDRYDIARIQCLPADLATGRYGISEPLLRCPAGDLVEIELALVPGLAFSPSGVRLGRGKGHFDKLLQNATDATRMGIGFEWQLLENIPTESHDERVDWVATPLRLLDCRF